MKNKLTVFAMLIFIFTGVSIGQITINGSGSYSTIQSAITAASAGDIIQVPAGTYNESIVIDKDGLQLRGAQYGVQANTGSRTVPASESIINGTSPVAIMANNVIVDGFTIQGSDASSFISGVWFNPGYSGKNGGFQILNNIIKDNVSGIGVGNDGTIQALVKYNLIQNNNNAGPGSGNGFSAAFELKNVIIENNTFDNNQVYLNGFESSGITGVQTVTLLNNEIKNIIGSGLFIMGSLNITITGNNIHNNSSGISIAGGGDNLTITNNDLKNNINFGISISDDYTVGSNSNIQAHTNNIETNTVGGITVTSGTYTGTLNATSNWWGNATGPYNVTTNPSGTGNSVSDNVDYSPWLGAVSGTIPMTYYGDPNDPDYISDAIALASSGDEINIQAGTYNSFTVNEEVTLTAEPGTFVNNGSPAITVAADNVTIDGFTFNYGTADYAIQVNANYTGTVIVNCNFNVTNAVDNQSTASVLAENNYWGFGGNINGPTIGSNPGGSGGVINENPGTVDYDPWVGKVTSPANLFVGTPINSFNISWDWLNFFGPNFAFQLDDGVGPLDVNTSVGTNSYTVSTPLLYNTTYTWYVRSLADPLNIWIGPFSFTTTSAIPSITSPSNNATAIAVNTTFSWSAVAGANLYQLEVNDDNTFTNAAEYTENINATTSSAATGLINNTTYYARVRSSNNGGGSWSSWSSTVTFTTVLATPVLTLPPDTFVGNSIPANLTWTLAASTLNVTFALDYSSVSNVGPWTNVPGVTSAYSLGGLLNNTTYYWRITATVSAGPPNAGELKTSSVFFVYYYFGTFNFSFTCK